MSSNEAETIYERVAKLEDEAASLRNELDILKNALKNQLARQQIKMIRRAKTCLLYSIRFFLLRF